MASNVETLQAAWHNSQKIAKESTLLPQIKFENYTSAIFSLGPFYYYVVDFFDMSLSNISAGLSQVHDLNPNTVTFNDIVNTVHPDDINFVSKVEKELIDFYYKKLPPGEILKYKSSYCFRSRMKNGEYRMLNHQSIQLTLDTNGGFGKSLNIHTDISLLSKENTYKYSIISLFNDTSYLNLQLETPVSDSVKFTKREREIIKLVADGKTGSEIASTLLISMNTLKTHRKNILHKSNCSNTAQLIKQCITQGVI